MISIRPCKKSDCRFLWNLRNEKSTRSSAFSEDYIGYPGHVKWFKEKIEDERSYIFIILKDRRRIGQVRLEIGENRSAEVDIGIVEAEQGKGVGSLVLKLVCLQGLQTLDLKEIIAHIKKENISSFRAFENADFSNTGLVRIKGKEAYRMVLR